MSIVEVVIALLLVMALAVVLIVGTPPGSLAVAGLILGAVLLFFQRLFRREPALTGSRLARTLAHRHLRKSRSIPGCQDLQIGASFPMKRLGDVAESAYDVKIVSATGEPRGYVVVNTSRSEFPIAEFTLAGPCLTEQFRERLGDREHTVVWVNPTLSYAVDPSGAIIASIGTIPPVREGHTADDHPVDLREQVAFLEDFQANWRERRREAVTLAWHSLPGGAKESSDLVEDAAPPGNYSVCHAEGYERSPFYQQIPAHEGANAANDYSSGCGPTAWTTLIGWHDAIWTPELLRGSETSNGASWGDPPEDQWNTYIDRIQMDISKPTYLDTHDCVWDWGDAGVTHDGRMEKGFRYIENELGHSLLGEDSGGDDLQKVYDYIARDRRPVLVKTPSHFCVAAGFWFDNDGDDHYLLLKTGWPGPDKWIHSKYLEKYWYMRQVAARTEWSASSVSAESATSPSLCTTTSTSTNRDVLWCFWTTADGRIRYTHSPAGSPTAVSSEGVQDLDAQVSSAIYSPTVCANGQVIYLLCVDASRRMKLLMHTPGKGWLELHLPDGVETKVRPAMTVSGDNWLSIAFADEWGLQVIASKRDLQRESPAPWPGEIGIQGPDAYWNQVDAAGANGGLSFSTYQGHTVLLWLRSERYPELRGELAARYAYPDGSDLGYLDTGWDFGSEGAAGLTESRGSLYGAFRSGDSRIVVAAFVPTWPREGETTYLGQEVHYEVHARLSLSERACLLDACVDQPGITVVELEDGAHPQLVVGWKPMGDHPLRLRLLSIDRADYCMDYRGKP